MINERLEALFECVKEAHTRIQTDFENINPVVSVNQKMRDVGIPADVLTIDCLNSKKRILVVLHDDKPDTVDYQLSYIDKDPSDNFEQLNSDELTSDAMYLLVKSYFSNAIK